MQTPSFSTNIIIIWLLINHAPYFSYYRCKRTNFDIATHAPLMIHVPGATEHGIVREDLTEFVDIFPTLADAADLPVPSLCPSDIDSARDVTLCREGSSLMPLITAKHPEWKDRVFWQFHRGSNMGYTVRTADFRYTEWVATKKSKPEWNKNKATELYDLRTDPDENRNVAGEKAYKKIQKELSETLREGWRAALPN